MKDYLKCPLSQEERDLITAIIWITAKDFKKQFYKRNYKNSIIPIDDLELSVEDEYNFLNWKTRGDFVFVRPLTKCEKKRIVEYVDRVLSELSLKKLKVALTFEEKLVLFLYYFEKNTEENVAIFLGVTRRTICNKKDSIENKKSDFLGGI